MDRTEVTIKQEFEGTGRVWLRGALPPSEIEELKRFSSLGHRPGARIQGSDPLFEAVKSFPFNAEIRKLWPQMRPVRLVSFDKNEGANWGVPWHQDRVIVVEEKAEVPGYTNWSQKAAAWHCEPPLDVLKSMLFVRIHLDHSTAENGAMEIAVGSHHEGKIAADCADNLATQYPNETTIAAPGDVLLLNMLTLHRSPSAISQTGRRTLRVDYAPFSLPAPLNWVV